MKKSVLALAVPAILMAGTASAGVNLYNDNGVTVDLSGAAEVQLFKGPAKDAKEKIRLDDGDLAFDVSVEVTDQLNAIAGLAFAFEDSEMTNAVTNNDQLWVGFSGDWGTLKGGRTCGVADDAGNTKHIEFGGDRIDMGTGCAGEVVRYDYDNGQFYFAGSVLDADNELKGYAGKVGARFGGLDARVIVNSEENDAGADETLYNVELDYGMDNWSVAGSYGSAKEADINVIALSADYTVNATTFGGGYTLADSGDTDASSVYFNVTQKLHSNVKAYGEIGFADSDDDTDVAYVVGMEVKF
jgi:hypothetical protein